MQIFALIVLFLFFEGISLFLIIGLVSLWKETSSERDVRWFVLFLILFILILLFACAPFVIYFRSSCDCGYFAPSGQFCEKCGAKQYDIVECCDNIWRENIPAYCPDCGFELESVGD